ncbi:hypothetical protein ATCC90586_007016 [Pythium insidiosum]|nr:hypothetical protein ATCC90586_007016 [Pythium insidiosum]
MAPAGASPPKAVYVKSKVAVSAGVEQTNPEERAIVASAQLRMRTAGASATRVSLPRQLFVALRQFLRPSSDSIARLPPTSVLPALLLGNERNAAAFDELHALGVTHICNLDFAARNYFEGKFVYIKLGLVDRADERLTPQLFAGVNQFLEACEAVGGRALVHCATGHALAPAFVVAFLVGKKQHTLDDALALVRSQRPGVALYPSFVDQLKEFEVLTRRQRQEQQQQQQSATS